MNPMNSQDLIRWKREWEELIREAYQMCLDAYIDSFVNASFTVRIFCGMLERDIDLVAEDHKLASGHKYALLQLLRYTQDKENTGVAKRISKFSVKKKLTNTTDNIENLNKFNFVHREKISSRKEEKKDLEEDKNLEENKETKKSKSKRSKKSKKSKDQTIEFVDNMKSYYKEGDLFDDKEVFWNAVSKKYLEEGIIGIRRFKDSTHQYYIKCQTKSPEGEGCDAFVYCLKDKDGSRLKIQNIQSEHNHLKLSSIQLEGVLACQMIPQEIKDKASKEFFDGEEIPVIVEMLKREFSKNYAGIVEHPKFKDIIRNYMNRELDKNEELRTFKGIIDKAKERYPDLNIRLRTNNHNIVTDMFIAFDQDKEKCIFK